MIINIYFIKITLFDLLPKNRISVNLVFINILEKTLNGIFNLKMNLIDIYAAKNTNIGYTIIDIGDNVIL